MSDAPVLVEPPQRLIRVERLDPALRFSHITAEDAAADHGGNRFDVPGAGVLYAATSAVGAFAETTAHFRLSASVRLRMRDAGASAGELETPALDNSWRSQRRLRELTLDSLPFVDIEHPTTHTYLTEHAASVLLSLGVQSLDVATVRGP